MSVVDQLVDMGFERERAEFAFKQTGSGIEQAMDWLVNNEGKDLAELQAAAAAKAGASASAEAGEVVVEDTPGSYKCNDCGRLLKDENAMMFHAGKTGHENFAESTEVLAPLTAEERAVKAAELKERIRAQRKVKDENERKEALEKEKRRIEEGKLMHERREKQKENEMREIAEERRRQKKEDEEAKKRVLEQIRLDKEARKARLAGQPAPSTEPTAPVHVAPPAAKVDYDQANLQIRLPDGKAVKQTFSANEPLSAVRVWLEMNHHPGYNFSLLIPFPRKMLTGGDYDTPLKALGLVPSASLVMTRSQ